MAGKDYLSHSYIRRLDDYHSKLVSCARLSAHLMDVSDHKSHEVWHQDACWLMRDMLVELAESLPFPPEDFMKLEAEVQP